MEEKNIMLSLKTVRIKISSYGQLNIEFVYERRLFYYSVQFIQNKTQTTGDLVSA